MSVRVFVRLFLEVCSEGACSDQSLVVVVDAEEQEETIAGLGGVRAPQGGMIVLAPLVQAEQHGAICIQELTEVVMGRGCFRLTKE